MVTLGAPVEKWLTVAAVCTSIFLAGQWALLAPAWAQTPSYRGEVTPLDDEILLRYRAIDRFETHMTVVATTDSPDVKSATIDMDLVGSIAAAGDDLRWRFDFRMAMRGAAALSDEPVVVNIVSNDVGSIESLDISGISPVSGEVLKPGTADYVQIARDVANQVRPLPHAPVGQGVDLFALISKDTLARFYGFGGLEGVDIDFDMTSVIVGRTTIRGRDFLLVDTVGTIRVSANGSVVSTTVSGWTAIDLVTSLSGYGEILMDTRQSGSSNNLEMMIEFSTEFQ